MWQQAASVAMNVDIQQKGSRAFFTSITIFFSANSIFKDNDDGATIHERI